MNEKIRNTIIKWSRKAEGVNFCFKFLTLVLCAFTVTLIFGLIDEKIFPKQISYILYIIFIVLLCIIFFLFVIKNILFTIKTKEDEVYNNKLSYVIFSSENIINSIFNLLFFIVVVVPFSHSTIFKSLLCFIILLMGIVIPKRIASYFGKKLKK